MMYKSGDKIVYGHNGVMTVLGIKEECVHGETKNYYVLKGIDAAGESLTYVPCDNSRLINQMAAIISREQMDNILSLAAKEPILQWIEDNRARSNSFKQIIEEGDRLKLLKMIRAIRHYSECRAREGKKNYMVDENIMHRAEKRIYSEIALILDCDYEAAKGYVNNFFE